jgi:hypothetical protein
LEYLYTCDCGITSDDLILFLGKLKSSFPGLREWYLQDNEIDGRGVSVLMDHLPSLFPILWCDEFMFSIRNPLANNPVMHNNEMMERLNEELTRRRERYEEELTRRREIEDSHEEEVHEEVS